MCDHSFPVRHRRRSRHPGLGFSQAEGLPAALPARERRGGRAAGALFVHRFRRLPRAAARRRRTAHRDRRCGRGPPIRPRCSARCAQRSPQAPRPEADGNGFPLHGGLVGVASYDLVRYFERLPARAATIDDCPDAHYVAPRSLLVFDHLTRRAALLHAGSEPERQSLRREVIRAMRGGLPGPAWQAKFGAPEASLTEAQYLDGRAPRPGVDRRGRRVPARAVGALRGALRPRSLRDLSRAAAAQPFSVHVLLRARRTGGGRLLARGAGQAQRWTGAAASDRRDAAARRGCRAGRRARGRTARRPEGKRRARDAGRPRAQRPRPGGGGGIGRSASAPIDRALQPRHAPRERRHGPPRRGPRRIRPVCRGVSRRYAGGRTEGARHGADRRDRARAARVLRRHGRLLRSRRRHGPGDHDPHAGVSRRHLQLPGGRRHRRRQRPAGGVPRGPREERGAQARARARAGGLCRCPRRASS